MKRRLQILLVTLVGVVGMLPSAPAQAASSCGTLYYCEYNWYSSSSWTTLVGQRITECDGSTYFWGQVTGYRQTISYPCEAP